MSRRYRLPGTVIKQTLAAWHIRSHASCNCNDVCAEMDQDGPDVVEQKLEYYIEEVTKSVRLWRKGNRFPVPQPPRLAVISLIEYGISTSRKEREEVLKSRQN